MSSHLNRRAALLVLLLVTAFFLPRLLALRGIPYIWHLEFGDGPEHVAVVDKLAKFRSFSADEVSRLKQLGVGLSPVPTAPWGVHTVASLWAGALGPMSIWTTQLTNGLFTLVLLLGVVGLGAALRDLRLGLWAALLVTLCPSLVGASWYLSLDYPLAAMTVFGFYLLVQTRGLTRLPYCLSFALWSALGLCVKMSYAVFLVLPGVVALVQGLRSGGPRLRVLAHGLLVPLVMVLGVVLLHGFNPRDILDVLRAHATAGQIPGMDTMAPWTVEWALAVPTSVAASFTSPLLALALPGLVLIHRRRQGLLLGLLWGSVVLWTLMAHKLVRYYLPLHPFLCLVTAWWVLEWISRRWQTLVLAGVVALYAATLVIAHEHRPPWLLRGHGETDMKFPTRTDLDSLRSDRLQPGCQMQPLVDAIRTAARGRRPSRVLWVGTLWDEESIAVGPPPPYVNIAVLLTQAIGDRVVENIGNFARQPQSHPNLLLVHAPALDPLRVNPRLVLHHQRTLTLSCSERSVPVVVSLYLQGGPGGE